MRQGPIEFNEPSIKANDNAKVKAETAPCVCSIRVDLLIDKYTEPT
jgi:hypothetical protein